MDKARATMQRIGLELIEERRCEVIAQMEAAGGRDGIDPDKTVLGKDLLSVLSMCFLHLAFLSHGSHIFWEQYDQA